MSFVPKQIKVYNWAFCLAALCLAWQSTTVTWAGESIVETIRALIEKGNALLSHGSYEQAIEEYEKVLDKEPNNPYARSNIVLAHNNWGITYFHQGKYEQAKKEWDIALKLDPNDRNGHNNIAVLKRELAKQGKTLDDIDTEKKKQAEAAKKEQEKKAADAAPSSAVVMLSAPQKQPASESSSETPPDTHPDTRASGAQLVAPANSNSGSGAMILSGGTSASSTNSAQNSTPNSATASATSSAPNSNADKGAIQTYGQQGYAKVDPNQAETGAAPVQKTKAQEELEAFKRLTSTSEKSAAQQSPQPETYRPSINTGAPLVFHSSARLKTDSGESADFMDDKLAPPANTARPGQQAGPPAQPAVQQYSAPQQSSAPQQYSAPAAESGTTESAQKSSSDNEESKPSRHHHKPRQVAEVSQPSSQSVPQSSIDSPIQQNSIDGVLNRLEVKIYGQATSESSIIKRLERMETDSFGRPSVGAISARLARLKKMYNVSD
jgi:tetratricopeptide (TPR) repeat protein